MTTHLGLCLSSFLQQACAVIRGPARTCQGSVTPQGHTRLPIVEPRTTSWLEQTVRFEGLLWTQGLPTVGSKKGSFWLCTYSLLSCISASLLYTCFWPFPGDHKLSRAGVNFHTVLYFHSGNVSAHAWNWPSCQKPRLNNIQLFCSLIAPLNYKLILFLWDLRS